MCAINGFTWEDRPLAERMNEVTKHRGPDGTGVFAGSGVSLGHNRLAIIDLSSTGAQPMKSGDGNLIITFNGEIYNYLELRRELEDGYRFIGKSDTEVILAGYAKWGEGILARLSGIFAFGLWDRRSRTLLLARDQMGVKPLYYHEKEGRLVFSSEIKAILEHDVPRTLDREAFNAYMRCLYTPAPYTMLASVKKLPPGHTLTFRDGKTAITRYWQRDKTSLDRRPRAALAAELRETVREAVRSQLVSDRPVGLYLSGGIDSSAVLDSMREVHTGAVETFSVGFELTKEEQKEKFNADFELARMTARQYGTNHHEVRVSADEVPALFEDAIWHLDEPMANATIVPMLKLARFAKEHVAVVLGGDGGDELFGGYERYRLSLIASAYQKVLPPSLRRLLASSAALQKLNTPAGVERFALFLFQKEPELRRVLASPYNDEDFTSDFCRNQFFSKITDPFETQFMETDRQSWLVDEALLRSDKMSMAGGLEQRVPLLDLSVVSLADRIPLREKVSFRQTKIILKEAFKNRIPSHLLHQPKRGWFSPGAKWLRVEPVASFAREILSPSYYEPTRELFDWNAVQGLLKRHQEGEYHATMLWAILGLQLWSRRFKVTL